DAEVRGADLRQRLAERGQAVRRRVRGLELLDLVADLDRGAVALEALPGLVALGDQALREPGLLQHRSLLVELRLRHGPVVAGLREAVAVLLQLVQGGLAVASG